MKSIKSLTTVKIRTLIDQPNKLEALTLAQPSAIVTGASVQNTLTKLKNETATKLILFFSVFNLTTGCLSSMPKKTESSDRLGAILNTNSSSPGKRPAMSPTQNSATKSEPAPLNCRDSVRSGAYSEDTSAECVRAQTLLAYNSFQLQMDPEVPYCILRQESSTVKDKDDPYQTDFNRLAVCKKGKYCGLGLAQFTFGTWSGHESTIRSNSEKLEKLHQCLNTLAAATNNPRKYANISIPEIRPSDLETLLVNARSSGPSDQLTPFYRDQAICMNALHLSEMNINRPSVPRSYAVYGRGKNRRKVVRRVASQSSSIGAKYNAGGTAGYGSNIARCVANFRAYDNAHSVAENTFYLKPNNRAAYSNFVNRSPANNQSFASLETGSL